VVTGSIESRKPEVVQIAGKETGAARAELATIADRIGRSRATVVRSVRRLIAAGVIEREEQRRGKRCYASLYRLVEPGSQKGAKRVPNAFRGSSWSTQNQCNVFAPVGC